MNYQVSFLLNKIVVVKLVLLMER